ncbi:MAG: hypothetical protein M3443_13210 [Actinomycetota bacterium]|nr:hypothetical protein [Actinomycetota bacterium]
MSNYGTSVSAWVRLDDDCTITHVLCGGEAEFEIGGQHGDLQLITSEDGLERLAQATSTALAELRASTNDE